MEAGRKGFVSPSSLQSSSMESLLQSDFMREEYGKFLGKIENNTQGVFGERTTGKYKGRGIVIIPVVGEVVSKEQALSMLPESSQIYSYDG